MRGCMWSCRQPSKLCSLEFETPLPLHGCVAQLIEHSTDNRKVTGLSPVTSTNFDAD